MGGWGGQKTATTTWAVLSLVDFCPIRKTSFSERRSTSDCSSKNKDLGGCVLDWWTIDQSEGSEQSTNSIGSNWLVTINRASSSMIAILCHSTCKWSPEHSWTILNISDGRTLQNVIQSWQSICDSILRNTLIIPPATRWTHLWRPHSAISNQTEWQQIPSHLRGDGQAQRQSFG